MYDKTRIADALTSKWWKKGSNIVTEVHKCCQYNFYREIKEMNSTSWKKEKR